MPLEKVVFGIFEMLEYQKGKCGMNEAKEICVLW